MQEKNIKKCDGTTAAAAAAADRLPDTIATAAVITP